MLAPRGYQTRSFQLEGIDFSIYAHEDFNVPQIAVFRDCRLDHNLSTSNEYEWRNEGGWVGVAIIYTEHKRSELWSSLYWKIRSIF